MRRKKDDIDETYNRNKSEILILIQLETDEERRKKVEKD